MNPAVSRIVLAGLCSLMLVAGSVAQAGESSVKSEASVPDSDPSTLDKLVANQPAKSPAESSDPAADKAMTINFSDFVKDGAGCGVPNLDTSGK